MDDDAGVLNPFGSEDPTGVIWCGYSDDGLTFHMDPRLVITPIVIDFGGVEDPTVVQTDHSLMVYYTGVHADRRQGLEALAEGPDPYSLEKREVVFKAGEGEGKFQGSDPAAGAGQELAAVLRVRARRRVTPGMARAKKLGVNWTAMEEMVPIREDSWDTWHLSPDRSLQQSGCDPVMFDNEATDDARWRIGWITFDQDCNCITGRGVEPLLAPPPASDREATDIAFAASAILQQDGTIHLYYSLEDRRCPARPSAPTISRPAEARRPAAGPSCSRASPSSSRRGISPWHPRR